MKWGPRSLAGQMALVLAVALLIAQSLNFVLLLQSRERLRDARDESALARVVNFLERDDLSDRLSEPGGERRIRGARFLHISETPHAQNYALRPRSIESIKPLLANANVVADTLKVAHLTPAEVQAWQVAYDRPAIRREFRNRRGRENRRSEQERIGPSVMMSVQLGEGQWLNVLQPLPPDPPLGLAAIGVQTLVTYLALLGAALLLTRRLSRPMARLTAATSHFLTDAPTQDLPSEGPEDIRQLTHAFTDMRTRVEKLFAEKDIMLGAIGHDLRTPLTSLRLRAEQIGDDTLRLKMIATIEEMSVQFEDILSLARHGNNEAPAEIVSFGQFTEDLERAIPSRRDHVSISAVDDDAMTIQILAVRRALRNLIENAIRYGEHANVSITRNGDNIDFIVHDRGPGIPADQMVNVREPFVRGELSRNRSTGGAGLGLAIVDKLAERQGGRLVLKNGEEGGLVATLTIPDQTSK